MSRPQLPSIFLLISSLLIQLLLSSDTGVSFCSAFIASTPLRFGISHSNDHGERRLLPLRALPTSSLLSGVVQDSILIIADNTNTNTNEVADVPFEDAFQDSVSLMDGPVGVLLAAFGVFVVLAIGFKAVMNQMDDAIEKVIRDFEATLREYYPKRWRVIEDTELKGLVGDERDIRLLQVMERLQQEEPAFMTQVADRGVPPAAAQPTVGSGSVGEESRSEK